MQKKTKTKNRKQKQKKQAKKQTIFNVKTDL